MVAKIAQGSMLEMGTVQTNSKDLAVISESQIRGKEHCYDSPKRITKAQRQVALTDAAIKKSRSGQIMLKFGYSPGRPHRLVEANVVDEEVGEDSASMVSDVTLNT